VNGVFNSLASNSYFDTFVSFDINIKSNKSVKFI
jgi:hypothetical protein